MKHTHLKKSETLNNAALILLAILTFLGLFLVGLKKYGTQPSTAIVVSIAFTSLATALLIGFVLLQNKLSLTNSSKIIISRSLATLAFIGLSVFYLLIMGLTSYLLSVIMTVTIFGLVHLFHHKLKNSN